MSIVTRPQYRRGQKQLASGHLNDADMQARQLRKGIGLSIDGGSARSAANSQGNQQVIIVTPTIYRAIEITDGGNSSSSSSGEEGRFAYIKNVNIETTTVSGPKIRVKIGTF